MYNLLLLISYLLSRFSQVTSTSGTSPGCGIAPTWTFSSTHHSNQTLGDRTFLVHIPAVYDPNTSHPVVLSYHGAHGTDVHQELLSGFSEKGVKINSKVRTYGHSEADVRLISGEGCDWSISHGSIRPRERRCLSRTSMARCSLCKGIVLCRYSWYSGSDRTCLVPSAWR